MEKEKKKVEAQEKGKVQAQDDTFGKRLVIARSKKGYSQEKLAGELDVSRQMVSKWELDMAVPRMSRIDKICEVLEVEANDLLRDKDRKNENDKEDNGNDTNDSGVKEMLKAQNNFLQQLQKTTQPVANKISFNFKTLMRGTAIFLLVTIALMMFAYLGTSFYKLSTLKNLSSKVEKYANLNNYYCKIRSFDDVGVESISEIWYKDGVYKFIDTTQEDGKNVIDTKILDLNEIKKYSFNEEERTVIKREFKEFNEYINGRYMYDQFPLMLKKQYSDYKKIAFGFNSFSYSTEDDMICLNINDEFVYLDDETYLPLSRSMSTNKKQRKLSQKFNKYYEITLDTVEDNDVSIPEGYTIIER